MFYGERGSKKIQTWGVNYADSYLLTFIHVFDTSQPISREHSSLIFTSKVLLSSSRSNESKAKGIFGPGILSELGTETFYNIICTPHPDFPQIQIIN